MTWAFAIQGLGAAEKLVLLALADNADDLGRCWPSQEVIATKASVSVRTVRTHLRTLEKHGLLSRVLRNSLSGRRSNLYFLNIGANIENSLGINPEENFAAGQKPPKTTRTEKVVKVGESVGNKPTGKNCRWASPPEKSGRAQRKTVAAGIYKNRHKEPIPPLPPTGNQIPAQSLGEGLKSPNETKNQPARAVPHPAPEKPLGECLEPPGDKPHQELPTPAAPSKSVPDGDGLGACGKDYNQMALDVLGALPPQLGDLQGRKTVCLDALAKKLATGWSVPDLVQALKCELPPRMIHPAGLIIFRLNTLGSPPTAKQKTLGGNCRLHGQYQGVCSACHAELLAGFTTRKEADAWLKNACPTAKEQALRERPTWFSAGANALEVGP